MMVIRCEQCDENGECDAKNYCMCGSPMEDHSMGSGHSPVSMHEYCGTEVEIDDGKS